MSDSNDIQVCKSCGFSGIENYCSRCGQPFKTKRISISGLLHDVFHFFTHLDRGFGYTLKKLIIAPGYMQRDYVEGERIRHQKPFSMFFICATVAALSRYWIFRALLKYYNAGNISEATFFHEYMVILHIAMLPLYAFITYLFFYRSKYNYAEIGVLILYTMSIFFLAATLIALLKFLWPDLDTAYIELPILIIYNVITFTNFFNKLPSWSVVLRSIVIIIILFFIVQVVEDFMVQRIS
jgi:uncharacterized protein DUF3667